MRKKYYWNCAMLIKCFKFCFFRSSKMATRLLILLFLVSRTCPVIQGSSESTREDDNENAIIDDIPNLLTSNSTREIQQNENLELYCQFNSDIPDQMMVIWTFTETGVKNSKHYSFGESKVYRKRDFSVENLSDGKSGMKLIVPNVSVSDSGDYKCSLNNPNGEIAVQNVNVVNSSAMNFIFVPFLLICSTFSIYLNMH